ncbi:hypothetical protein J1N35_020105 [Gossypium stocksii]|uniref:Uncharacterized protein n=1 Tax=Gossypium stocksii TaxID=47602 RepID=A0A9D3VE86_9ROSI|nr:hypothetical protein J1N35_020105 [Gossypium stocksii]
MTSVYVLGLSPLGYIQFFYKSFLRRSYSRTHSIGATEGKRFNHLVPRFLLPLMTALNQYPLQIPFTYQVFAGFQTPPYSLVHCNIGNGLGKCLCCLTSGFVLLFHFISFKLVLFLFPAKFQIRVLIS